MSNPWTSQEEFTALSFEYAFFCIKFVRSKVAYFVDATVATSPSLVTSFYLTKRRDPANWAWRCWQYHRQSPEDCKNWRRCIREEMSWICCGLAFHRLCFPSRLVIWLADERRTWAQRRCEERKANGKTNKRARTDGSRNKQRENEWWKCADKQMTSFFTVTFFSHPFYFIIYL